MPPAEAYAPAMPAWSALLDVLLLLGLGFVLGAIAERLRQSAILGYLAAGMLVGPHALHLVKSPEEVTLLAELGVALLLFSIGLEFPWRRLKQSGRALLGGGIQIALTIAAGAGLALAGGLSGSTAFIVGAMLALSSTAYVLRLLSQRAALDSPHGRLAVGVLLAQDAAVVPLVLVASVLLEGQALGPTLLSLARLVGFALLLVLAFRILFHVVAPRLLGTEVLRRNRELPLLLAVTSGLGSAAAAHEFGISPAIGAFLAGVLLAESPFATQVRSDVSALRTILMTLFFGSIGMLGNPAWIGDHLLLVLGIVALVVVLKTAFTATALWVVRAPWPQALAAGVCLAQIGEFSFVIAEMSRGTILDDDVFQLVVSVTIATLVLTPYLMSFGPWLAERAARWRGTKSYAPAASALEGHVVLVGYGPTGEAVGHRVHDAGFDVHVIDLNPSLVARAKADGLDAHLGDATQPDVLEHVNVPQALAVVVTLPDTAAARRTIEQVRALAPGARVFARARYHMHKDRLLEAGAELTVDEEEAVGRALAERLGHALRDSGVGGEASQRLCEEGR